MTFFKFGHITFIFLALTLLIYPLNVWQPFRLSASAQVNIVNVSDNAGSSVNPDLGIKGENTLYVVWDDTNAETLDTDILISKSADGVTFDQPINLSNTPSALSHLPAMVVSEANDVLVTWETITDGAGDIFLATSTDGVAFNTTNVSDNPGGSSNPAVAISGNGDIYVVWTDDGPDSQDIFLATSTDGVAFNTTNVSDNLPGSTNPDLAISSIGELFVAWEDLDFETGFSKISSANSMDGGATFGEAITLSEADTFSVSPQIGISTDDSVSVVWTTAVDEFGNFDVLMVRNVDYVTASLGDVQVSNIAPKWGIDEIIVEGVANSVDTSDTVTVEWGDGTLKDQIPIFEDGSWSSNHVYDSSAIATNPNQIVAKLISGDGREKTASAPTQVNVERHGTTLTLHSIASVKAGSEIIVTGTLNDLDDATSDGIAAKTITFSGTGDSGLSAAISDENGTFLSSAQSPDSAADQWTVQAHFGGDDLYDAAESNINAFDTVDNSTFEFQVEAGETSHVELSSFNASIDFENLAEGGKLYVWTCETPESPRYLSLGICLRLSPNFPLEPDSAARIHISYSDDDIPAGYTDDNVDIFHLDFSGTTDITELRDTSSQTVTGITQEFSEFIVGIALHPGQASGSIRQQVFVGESEISVDPSSIALDKEAYEISDSPKVTINDSSANTDGGTVNNITAAVSSTTSLPNSIRITLVETGPNTGIFLGSFTLSEGSSSGNLLEADTGDDITVSYKSAQGKFGALLDEIIESGVADVRSFLLDPELEPIAPFGAAIEMTLIDAQLSSSAVVTITMSFANIDLGSGDSEQRPEFLKLFQRTGDTWQDITKTGAEGHDLEAMTITGITNSAGIFTIGCDSSQQGCQGPGRGGGGLPRPGTGILLDSRATIERGGDSERDSGSSGGSGGTSRSTAIAPTPSGDNVETSVRTESGLVLVQFESVKESSGHLKVEANELSVFEDFFDELAFLPQDNDEHGIVHLDGITYSTAGDVFDLDATSVNFDGKVSVTIPYDEDVVASFSDLETNVRLIHYNEDLGTWEDRTSSVDEIMNTVTGTLDSLSPVTAAIIIESDIQNDTANSITRLAVMTPSLLVSGTGQATLSVPLSNIQAIDQNYVLLVQIVDETNIAQRIDWQAGSLAGNQESIVSISWNDMEKGQYRALILLLTDMENPYLLSEPIHMDFSV